MRIRYPHPFKRIHEPMRMDLLAWLALLAGVMIALFLNPQVTE